MIYDNKFFQVGDSVKKDSSNRALDGYPIGINTGTDENENLVYTSVERFRREATYTYSGYCNNIYCTFNPDSRTGTLISVSGISGKILYYMNSKTAIEREYESRAAAGDSETDEHPEAGNATITTLNAKDYFAQEALNALINRTENPMDMTDSDIYKITTTAYKMAQSMLNVAAYYRKSDPEAPEGGYQDESVVVGTPTLTTNTEKLLNNISLSLIDYARNAAVDGKVGLRDLIQAINDISISGGGGSEVGVTSMPNLVISSMPSVNLSGHGIGSEAANPIYVCSSSNDDARIKEWLNAVTVEIDGTAYHLTVPNLLS